MKKNSDKQRRLGTLPDNRDYESLVDRFRRDEIWRAQMKRQGRDEDWCRETEALARARQAAPVVTLSWAERQQRWGGRRDVASSNKTGGPNTTSTRAHADYKRYSEEARQENQKRFRESSASGDRRHSWQDSSWGSSSSNWNATGDRWQDSQGGSRSSSSSSSSWAPSKGQTKSGKGGTTRDSKGSSWKSDPYTKGGKGKK